MKPLYVTTPLYYASGPPHVGHAYTTVVADALTRRARQELGEGGAFLLTGTDEHGQKIERAAEAAGLPPQTFVDGVAEEYARAWRALNIRADFFIRTSDPEHAEWVRQVWERLAGAGDIYKGQYQGLYCEGCEAFVSEQNLQPGNLCPDHGTAAQRVSQDCYFFRLSRYREDLLQLLQREPPLLLPAGRQPEVFQRLEEGLEDLCISRPSRGWGIGVPGDPDHEVYVWVDALLGYVFGMRKVRGAWDRGLEAGALHVVGKEIVTFHAVYWPALLRAAGLPPPAQVLAHGWWTVRGEKMSKTRGNVVDPVPLAQQLGPDALRYFLLREVPLGADGDISPERLLQRYNSELCNDLGNLLNRTLHLAEKRSGGLLRAGAPDPELAELAGTAADTMGFTTRGMYGPWQPSCGLDRVLELVRAGNAHLERCAPWSAKCQNASEVVYNAAELLRWVALLGSPFMPDRCAEVLRQLGIGPSTALPRRWGEIPDSTAVRRGPLLFPRLTEEQVAAAWRAATGSEEPDAHRLQD